MNHHVLSVSVLALVSHSSRFNNEKATSSPGNLTGLEEGKDDQAT